MSEWKINIPFRSRDETIREAIEGHVDSALEDPEESRVALQVIFDAGVDGHRTMGDLLDHVAGLDADGRRQLLDRARANRDLESTEDIDSRERFEAVQRALPPGRDHHVSISEMRRAELPRISARRPRPADPGPRSAMVVRQTSAPS